MRADGKTNGRAARIEYTIRMKRIGIRCILASLAFSVIMAAQQSKSESTEPKLSADDLKNLLEKKDNLFFLDVREPKELEELGTIKGYTNIPLAQLESRLSEIPKDKLIVTA